MGDESDLTGNGGVLKAIIKEAKTDAIGPTEDLPLVDVRFLAFLAETGELFSNSDDKIFSFEIGSGSVIDGFDIGVKTMKVGEIATITCQPDYAYGSAGFLPEIPAYATLIYRVELVACRPRKIASPGSASYDIASLKKEFRRMRELSQQFELDLESTMKKLMKPEDGKKVAKKRRREKEKLGVDYDLTGDGGVFKKIIWKGRADAIGPTTDLPIIDVYYNGVIVEHESGKGYKIFEDDEYLSFPIDTCCVMRGWDIALQTMKVGDIATITCKPDYAYGSAGSPPEIPGKQSLSLSLSVFLGMIHRLFVLYLRLWSLLGFVFVSTHWETNTRDCSATLISRLQLVACRRWEWAKTGSRLGHIRKLKRESALTAGALRCSHIRKLKRESALTAGKQRGREVGNSYCQIGCEERYKITSPFSMWESSGYKI